MNANGFPIFWVGRGEGPDEKAPENVRGYGKWRMLRFFLFCHCYDSLEIRTNLLTGTKLGSSVRFQLRLILSVRLQSC